VYWNGATLAALAEVRALRERGDLHLGLPSMRCVGYRQAWEALAANDFSDLSERGAAATRQLAKRQITWLRSMPKRLVVACDEPQADLHVLALLQRLMAA
ncbi:MAG: tRNA (adenosine(37)-N6)-dimethylallyltransferase MiaA, partial [Paucibacter sp.]|nr:tRNA (adenosine(37)-N6)-dimethylallyltransferase MiaA [Roseateles sp.]